MHVPHSLMHSLWKLKKSCEAILLYKYTQGDTFGLGLGQVDLGLVLPLIAQILSR